MARWQVGHLNRWATWRSLTAAHQSERDLRVGLRGALLDAVPLQESHAAAIVTAADFRIQRAVRRQADTQQLEWGVAVEGHIEHTAGRHLCASAAVLSREPQQLGD